MINVYQSVRKVLMKYIFDKYLLKIITCLWLTINSAFVCTTYILQVCCFGKICFYICQRNKGKNIDKQFGIPPFEQNSYISIFALCIYNVIDLFLLLIFRFQSQLNSSQFQAAVSGSSSGSPSPTSSPKKGNTVHINPKFANRPLPSVPLRTTLPGIDNYRKKVVN